ncbi:FAD-dependent oxidoreductase [Armatimonas sp.]|uniref:FAD-dependent oxidoreductase n=1 Tax=Armatimonas sp. TaxID=1872638 RepID=UPI00374D794D
MDINNFKINGLGCDNLYHIGLKDSLITIHSQQMRSKILADFLSGSISEDNRSNICIIGAGIAGLTFIYQLVEKGWRDIVLLEKLPDLLAIQNGCDTRWVHPNIIDWPDDGSTNPKSSIGILDWEASTASNVAYGIEKQWLDFIQRKTSDTKKYGRPATLISVHLGVTYIHVQTGAISSSVEWIRDSRVHRIPVKGSKTSSSGVKKFKYVVFATGYGIESQSKFSYWRNEDYGQLHVDGLQRNYVVAGLGDGAISDLLRLTTKNFRTDRAIKEISQLIELEECLKKIKSDASDPSFDLMDAFSVESVKRDTKKRWDGFFNYFVDNRRDDTRVFLFYRKNTKFSRALNSSRASFLNKLFLFSLFKSGAFQYVDNDIDSVSKAYIDNDNYKIVRHGADRVEMIKKLINDGTVEIKLMEQPISDCKALLASNSPVPGESN